MVDYDVSAQSPSPRESVTDAELTARFEREALPLLDPLYRGALVLAGDRSEAADLLELTMMNAYRGFGSLDESADLRSSLYRALTNVYIIVCRTRRNGLSDTITDRQPAASAAHSSAELSLAQVEALEALPAAAITKAMRALRQDTRMVVYYSDVEDFSLEEIADITNRTVSAVMSLLRRGSHQLRHLLLAAGREQAACQSRKDAPKNRARLNRLPESDTCARQLDWFDREIVRYVLMWAPHDKIWNEDVYPTFGMTVEQLVDRFRWIILTSVPRLGCLAKSDRELLDEASHVRRVFGRPL